jgi:O-acetyl-ADP-ribose deacetylase (regulator of RNase III)
MIKYVTGDATEPQGDGNKLIIHCNNSVGGWGRGFVLALSSRWANPEIHYREWARTGIHNNIKFELGEIQPVQVEDDVFVINMVGQKDYVPLNIKIGDKNVQYPPVRYGAVEECLLKVAKFAIENNASVHAPRLGAGLAGASWAKIEEIIERVLCDNGVLVTVYDLENSSYNP